MPKLWSEDITLILCDYCLSGSKCSCEAKDAEECDFCESGCDCGYENYHECECDGCHCYDLTDEEQEEGEECEFCQEGCTCGSDDYPSSCYCSCECVRCTCFCECPSLVIDANSFNDWVRDMCYICDPECLEDSYLSTNVHEKRCLAHIGPYQFFIRTVPTFIIRKVPKFPGFGGFGMPSFLLKEEELMEIKEVTSIPVVQDGWRGTVKFDGPVHMPILARPNQYTGKLQVWMSLSPMEVMSQMNGFYLAEGHVLIGGLGMGWLTQKVLQKSLVTQVTQVELDPHIIDFFGNPLAEMYPNLELIHGDIWEFLDNVDISQFDTILLDIWPGYINARADPNFKAIKKAHPRVWGWGEEKFKNKKR